MLFTFEVSLFIFYIDSFSGPFKIYPSSLLLDISLGGLFSLVMWLKKFELSKDNLEFLLVYLNTSLLLC